MYFEKGTYIRINQTRCLNYQHHGVECSHCVTHCPGEALYIEDNEVQLNQESCLGCGLCFSNCPTEVFQGKCWDEAEVIRSINKQGKSVTKLFCGKHELPYLKKDEKDKGAIQLITCLSSLSKVAWYEIGLKTNVELHLENCHQCSMKSCIERIQLAVEIGAQWLKSSGHEPQFIYIYNSDNNAKKKILKAIPTGLEVTSRRDLLLSFIGSSKKKVQHILEEVPLNSNSYNRKEKKESYLPSWHLRLINSYVCDNRENRTPAHWPTIEKHTTCIHCGICSDNCPSQALNTSLQGRKVKTLFTSGLCLDCRLCMLFCPTESITRDRQLNSNPFKQVVLQEVDVSECIRCETLMTENEQSGLCYWCKNEAIEADLLNDAWKNLISK